jgi:hypothetical protein
VLRERSKADPVPIHMVVRDRAASEPGSPASPAFRPTPTVHYEGSPVRRPLFPAETTDAAEGVNSPASDQQQQQQHACNGGGGDANTPCSCGNTHAPTEEAEPHFHAVTVSERELAEFRIIFDRKKGPDGRVSLPVVRQVLQSYWRFIHREGFEAVPTPFPEHKIEQLRQKVGGEHNSLNLEQFLAVFYLFDNPVAEEPCIHGELERVRVATAQLHSVMAPELEFFHDRFEEVYHLVCGDENRSSLTCREMELLYYMYSAYVLEKQREAKLVARVQAIVRMKLQSTRYKELQQAARTLQCAWRMRMFVSDRQNHERITEFLKVFMQPQDKPGRSF